MCAGNSALCREQCQLKRIDAGHALAGVMLTAVPIRQGIGRILQHVESEFASEVIMLKHFFVPSGLCGLHRFRIASGTVAPREADGKKRGATTEKVEGSEGS